MIPTEGRVKLRVSLPAPGHRGKQQTRVRMLRAGVDLVRAGDLDDLAVLHHHHLFGHVADHRQVVRDEQVAHCVFVLQILQEVQQLGLDRDVERRDRLVADQDLRTQGERAGDRDPLALAAGELVRVFGERVRGEAHLVEQLQAERAPPGLAAADAVDLHRLHQDLAHREARIERGIRILEHDLDAPLVGIRRLLRQRQQIPALEQHFAAGSLVQPHEQQADRGLAGPGFADHPERLALGHLERGALDRFELAPAEKPFAEIEALREPARLQDDRLVAAQAAPALAGFWPCSSHEVIDDRQALRPAIERWAAGKQRPSIGVLGGGENFLGAALLADLAVAHHHDLVGDLAHERQVVRDEQYRHPAPRLQAGDQLQDLALHGDVERRGRLIGDEQLRLAGDRHGDHDALLLASGELERVGAELRLRLGEADLVQKLDRAQPRLRRGQSAVLPQRLRDLESHREHRVERAHRLLEDHRDLGASQRLQIAVRGLQETASQIVDAARSVHRGVLAWQQAHDGERRHRLAAARFSDQRDGAALGDVEADALEGAQSRRLVDAEVDRQVAHAEQAHFSLGSSASRSASVSRLKAVTSSAIAKVAAAICHHLPRISSLCASASMLPQDTVSTPTPKPRKVRITSDLMNSTTCSESCTSTTWLTLGRMWTNMRRHSDAPIASAASTYSRTLCFMYSARISRKIPVQPVSPRIRITVSTPFWLTTAATASTSSRYGIEVNTL